MSTKIRDPFYDDFRMGWCAAVEKIYKKLHNAGDVEFADEIRNIVGEPPKFEVKTTERESSFYLCMDFFFWGWRTAVNKIDNELFGVGKKDLAKMIVKIGRKPPRFKRFTNEELMRFSDFFEFQRKSTSLAADESHLASSAGDSD